MRIACVGGGPAGLYFAELVKRSDPRHEVVVFERNRSGDTFGFGVVFSDPTLAYLELHDVQMHRDLLARAERWVAIEVRLRDRILSCEGQGFSAIGRAQLLRLLSERARAAGVTLNFESAVGDDAVGSSPDVVSPAALDGFDLVVVADGARSNLRDKLKAAFRPAAVTGKTKFIWYGTTQRFSALTFLFEENEHGAFAVHAYPYDSAMSTFLVETDEGSWRRAGLDRLDQTEDGEARGIEYCRKLFAKHLGDHALVSNRSRWQSFRTLTTENWHHGRYVLMGDAAHTAHFSVGSGTKMALDDALALSRALAAEADPSAAIAAYEAERRRDVARIQSTAGPSLGWWESFRHLMSFAPEQFAFHFLTRNLRLTRESIMRRDPNFVAAVDAWHLRETRSRPLDAPFTLKNLRLANRLASPSTASPQPGVGPLPSPALLMVERDRAESLDALRHRIRVARGSDGARAVGLSLRLRAENATSLAEDVELVKSVDVDLIELAGVLDFSALDGLRAASPNRALAVRIDEPGEEATTLELVRRLRAHGCDAVTIGPDSGPDDRRGHEQRLALADRVRNAGRMATVLWASRSLSLDELETIVLAGRADIIVLSDL